MADITVSTDIDSFLQSATDAVARTNLGLGTAATRADAFFATGAEGDLATTAQQPPVEGPFVDGDKTKLNGIATGAEVNTINTTSTGEPSATSPVYNVVNISQVDYDAAIVAGSTVSTTFYIIT